MIAKIEMKSSSLDFTHNSPPLVVHIIHHLIIGGLENGLVNLVNSIPEDEYSHVIICLSRYSDFKERIRNKSVRVYCLNKSEGDGLSLYFKLYKLLKKLSPQIVHTRNLGTIDCAVVAAFSGVKIRIHSEHGWVINDIYGSNVKYKYLRKICNIFINKHIALSKDIQNWLVEKIKVKKSQCVQIYNGVDTQKFRFNIDNRDASRSSIGLNDSDIVVGSVGRLNLIKDYETLVLAFEKLVAINGLTQSVKLVIVGDGECYNSLKKLIHSKGLEKDIFLVGERSDISTIVCAFDIFALCSLNEGISNTILEAMSVGLPVVATNVGGNSELITNKVTGSLVELKDINNLAKAIHNYILHVDIAKQHGMNARKMVKENFSLDNMVERYKETYNRCLANK